MNRRTAPAFDSLRDLRSYAARLHGSEWAPGKWGKRFSRNSNWVLVADDACLKINSDEHPLKQIRTVQLRRGLIWAKLLIDFNDNSSRLLSGLTNRNAMKLVRQIHIDGLLFFQN